MVGVGGGSGDGRHPCAGAAEQLRGRGRTDGGRTSAGGQSAQRACLGALGDVGLQGPVVERVWVARVRMQFDGGTGGSQAAGAGEVLAAGDAQFADLDVDGRQPGEVARLCRGCVTGRVGPSTASPSRAYRPVRLSSIGEAWICLATGRARSWAGSAAPEAGPSPAHASSTGVRWGCSGARRWSAEGSGAPLSAVQSAAERSNNAICPAAFPPPCTWTTAGPALDESCCSGFIESRAAGPDSPSRSAFQSPRADCCGVPPAGRLSVNACSGWACNAYGNDFSVRCGTVRALYCDLLNQAVDLTLGEGVACVQVRDVMPPAGPGG